MFLILTELVDFLWKGITAYASTDEGRQELNDIFAAVEAEGIDIPFYQSDEEADEPPLDLNRSGKQPTDYAARFLEKHPEFAKRGEQ